MKSTLFGNKKGSIVDPIFSGAYILLIVITIFISLFIWYEFQSTMSATIAGQPIASQLNQVMSQLRSAYNSMDYVFPFLVGGLLIVSVIFAYRTGANIAWGIMALIVWGIALLISAVYVNIYGAFADQFPTVVANTPVIDAIISNMHYFTLFWLALITAVMFRKNNAEDEYTSAQRRFASAGG